MCFGVRGLECVSGRSPSARHKFALLPAFFIVVFCPEERHFAAVNRSLYMVGVYTLFLVRANRKLFSDSSARSWQR